MAASPLVPGYVPFALLVALEAAALLAWVPILVRQVSQEPRALRLCARCARLYRRTEASGSCADAIAVGALAFLAALPFVTAGFEDGITPGRALLGVSAVIAVLAVAAEADALIRAAAARLWPTLRWSAERARVIGGGARWLGVVLVAYLFQPRDALLFQPRDFGTLFGDVGKRLAVDLPSTAAIMTAATLLAAACFVAVVSRWLIPLLLGSLPTAFAPARESHGTEK